MPSEKYMTVERAEKLIADAHTKADKYGVKLPPPLTSREACIYAECLIEAVRADALANRVPRKK
jgi:hypothetical protein